MERTTDAAGDCAPSLKTAQAQPFDWPSIGNTRSGDNTAMKEESADWVLGATPQRIMRIDMRARRKASFIQVSEVPSTFPFWRYLRHTCRERTAFFRVSSKSPARCPCFRAARYPLVTPDVNNLDFRRVVSPANFCHSKSNGLAIG